MPSAAPGGNAVSPVHDPLLDLTAFEHRAPVCILAPSRVIGEAFARAMAAAGWGIEVVDASDRSTAAQWWDHRRVVLVFLSMMDSVPAAVLSGGADAPTVLIVDDGSAHRPRASRDRLVHVSMATILRELGAHSDGARIGRDLTPRHLEILQLVARGCTTDQVGERLGIASKTVNNHLSTVYRRLKARNLTQAVLIVVRAGLVDFGEN